MPNKPIYVQQLSAGHDYDSSTIRLQFDTLRHPIRHATRKSDRNRNGRLGVETKVSALIVGLTWIYFLRSFNCTMACINYQQTVYVEVCWRFVIGSQQNIALHSINTKSKCITFNFITQNHVTMHLRHCRHSQSAVTRKKMLIAGLN